MFRTSFSIIVHDGRAMAGGDIVDIDGKRRPELLSMVVTGTVDANGVFRLGGTFFDLDATFEAKYTGALNASGGTLSGTQNWTRAGGGDGVVRACKGTVLVVDSARQ
jgi:hypothetical protein